VGYSNAYSKDSATDQDIQSGTPDVEVHLAYTPNPTSTWFADYSRRFGFSADGSSYQVVDTADLIGEWNLRDDFLVRARGEYSRVEAAPPTGLRRAYYSFGAALQYKVLPHVALDSGITYRWGVVPGSGSTGDFGDFLFSVGAALLF